MSSYVPPHLRGKTAPAPAPVSLRQGTMATSTSSRPPVQSPLDFVEEFPELKALRSKKTSHPKDTKTAWSQGAGQRFSDLSRSWAIQQKEEEEERNRQAKERLTAEQQEREREKKERAYFRVVDPTKILYGSSSSHNRKEAVYDIGGDQDDIVEEVYEEDPEPEQIIEDISYRRSKHDLY